MTPRPIILHVEGNRCIQRLVAAVLGPELDLDLVRTVADAQAYLRARRPDLIITADRSLRPGTAADVICLAAGVGVPVVVLTGTDRKYPPHVRVLRKPATVEALRALVDALDPGSHRAPAFTAQGAA